MVKMAQANFEEAKITNIEMNSHALLEIAPGIHSPFCPYLVDHFACWSVLGTHNISFIILRGFVVHFSFFILFVCIHWPNSWSFLFLCKQTSLYCNIVPNGHTILTTINWCKRTVLIIHSKSGRKICGTKCLKKGWILNFPIGQKWTLNRLWVILGKWYWKFFSFGQLTLPNDVWEAFQVISLSICLYMSNLERPFTYIFCFRKIYIVWNI